MMANLTPQRGPTPPFNPDPTQRARLALTALAKEIATNFEELDAILRRKGISNDTWAKIEKNPFFVHTLAVETEAWKAPQNAARRIQLQALFTIEQSQHVLAVRLADPNENLTAVNETMKVLMKQAGIGENGGQAGTGEKFVISINLGDGKPIHHEVTQMIDVSPTGDIDNGTATSPTPSGNN